ncbi:uncharacterized protein LOC144624226 isoform X1 [Crassostrea virginica]
MLVQAVAVFSTLLLSVHGAGMTLESMAAQIVHQLNPSGSHVTYDQLRQFIGQNYDRNNDGCVSVSEFTVAWTTGYPESVEVARKFFNNMDMDGNHCMDDIEVLVNGIRNNQHLTIHYPLGAHDVAVIMEVYHPTTGSTGSGTGLVG